MHDPLQRLVKVKLSFLATMVTVVGLTLLFISHWAGGGQSFHWLSKLPITDLGSDLFTTGFVVIAFNYVEGRDSEERATERLRRVLTAEAPAIRDAVIDGFAFDPSDLARVSTPETLDRVICNSLSLRLGDATFAEEVYADIRDQAVAAAERWHDVRMSIKLAPSEASKPDRPLLITTVHKEFVVTPSVSTRRFICTSDPEEYRELAQDAPGASAWFLSPTTGLSADTQAAFELLDFSVDGEPRTISRTTRRGSQIYTATIGKEALEGAKPVVVAFTYRTLTAAFGHLLYFDIEQPSRDVAVSLDYDGCGIAGVSVLDFIASSQQARIVRSPSSVPNKSVAVEFDGWAFPRSGVAFVWVLEYEFKRHVPPKPRGSPPGSSACRETLRIGPHGRQSPIRHGAVKAVFA